MLLDAKYLPALIYFYYVLSYNSVRPEERSFLVKVNKDQSREALPLSLSLSHGTKGFIENMQKLE